jgi:hypothetical protein
MVADPVSALDDLISEISDMLTTAAPLTPEQQDALQRYGGYQLQWDDNDTTNPPLYEGQGRTSPPDQLPPAGTDGYVTVLQNDLQAIGIFPDLPIDGVFDQYTSWQLREFQIYAGMATVATVDQAQPASAPLGDRLTPTQNAAQYTGPITGKLDGPTALALKTWKDNGYACPVVAESRDSKDILAMDNVWYADAQTGYRIWVTDLTGTYNVDPARIAAQGALGNGGTHPRILAGTFTTSAYGNGPVCERGTAWTDNTIPDGTDITIDTLAGVSLDNATAATISTYNVIRAVAHVECPENFDVINGYDDARISVGPYHFTLYLLGGPSEMPALLSYLATALPDQYTAAFGRYGIYLANQWPAGADPFSIALFDKGQVKWTTFPRQIGLQVGGAIVSMAQTNLSQGNDADYFRNWHWFYRWVMAWRMFPDFRQQCWSLCRYRIQALQAAAFPKTFAGLPNGTTLGQVYTSEYAVAALLRAHVNAPAAVIASRGASAFVVNSLQSEMGADPSLATNWPNWTNEQHQAVDLALVEGLLAAAANHKNANGKPSPWPYGADLMKALGYVSDTNIALSQDAHSFQFDPPPS